MKVQSREIVIKPKAEMSRGFVEGEVGEDFLRLYLRAMPEHYDYSNWQRKDLQELADCILWVLEKTAPKQETKEAS